VGDSGDSGVGGEIGETGASGGRPARSPPLALVVLAAVLVGAAAAWTWLAHEVKARVLEALGPRATVGAIAWHYPTLVLEDVRITADGATYAWPAHEEGRARRVEFEAGFAALWAMRSGAPLHVARVLVQDGYLSTLHTRGHLMLLPALREQARAKAVGRPQAPARVEGAGAADTEDAEDDDEPGLPASAAVNSRAASVATAASAASPAYPGARYPIPGPPLVPSGPRGTLVPQPRPVRLVLEQLRFERMQVDFFDATVPAAKPHRLELDDAQADIANVALPPLDTPIALDLRGNLRGVEGRGPVAVKGRFTPATHDADLAVQCTGVDLVMLQPYVLRLGEGEVRRGRIDLQLDARVRNRELHAPGRLSLTGLEFASPAGTFAGVERRAVIAAMSKNGRLDARFTLEGRIDAPKFKLDESLAAPIAAGTASAVGSGVVGAVQSAGEAIKGLFGGGASQPKKAR
jgi:hypothetical protein